MQTRSAVLSWVFQSRLIKQELQAGEGIAGLSAAVQSLIAARAAMHSAVGNRWQHQERRETFHGMPPANDSPRRREPDRARVLRGGGRFRRSRDLGAYLGLVPRRFQSGEVDDMTECRNAAPAGA